MNRKLGRVCKRQCFCLRDIQNKFDYNLVLLHLWVNIAHVFCSIKLTMKKNSIYLFLSFSILCIVINACTSNDDIEHKETTELANKQTKSDSVRNEDLWTPPDTSTIPHDEFGEMVRYGRELIVNTAYYIGPEGKAGKFLGNKMNCTNCHLDAGTKPYAFNFYSTHARYPQYTRT